MTAVEKLELTLLRIISFDSEELRAKYKERIANAKEMEKQQQGYSEEDMIEASKYGYNFHKTTQFPQQKFEDSCIRNTQQWLKQFKKK
jgi:hypothetical protein